MKLNINLEDVPVCISKQLLDLINTHIPTHDKKTSGCSINFRDTSYSPENGGFHPVEIGLQHSNGEWTFDYITDFSYSGGPYPELIKEIDFLFTHHALCFAGGFPQPLNHGSSKEFYQMWESNFLSYVEMECFDEIKVNWHS